MAKQILPHTAAATWSGFIYQGRVALYHALKLIAEKSPDEINALHLQLDSLEDFAIVKYNQQGNIIPITLHQVKAVKSNHYSTYEADFNQLEQKKVATGIADVEAYFHLSTQNTSTNDEIENQHPGLKMYCYDNNDGFCPLPEIDNKVKAIIVIALQKYNIPGHQNNNNIQILYDILEKKIADKVTYIHAKNHRGEAIAVAAYENTICLSDFLDAIRQDITAIIQDEEYFEGKIKSNLNRYYQEFCLDCEENQLTDDIRTKMDNYLYLFNALHSTDFKAFLQSIRPHKEISYRDLQEYGDCLSDDEMKDAFFQILLTIKVSNNGNGIGWTCSEKKQYYPTSITYSNSDANKKNARERILKTAFNTMVDVPFNSDYLITSECNVDDIEACANNVSHLNTGDLGIDDDEKRNRITQWKKVSLIDLETAKNKLND